MKQTGRDKHRDRITEREKEREGGLIHHHVPWSGEEKNFLASQFPEGPSYPQTEEELSPSSLANEYRPTLSLTPAQNEGAS